MKLEVKPVGHGHLYGVLSYTLDVTGDEDLGNQEQLVKLGNAFVALKEKCPYIKLVVIKCFDKLKHTKQESMTGLWYTIKSNGLTLMGITSPAYQQEWFTKCDFRVFSGTLEDYKHSLNGLVNEFLVDDSPEYGLLTLPAENQHVYYNKDKVRDLNDAIIKLSEGQNHTYGFYSYKEMV